MAGHALGRREFLTALGSTATLLGARRLSAAPAGGRRPNVVWILSEDNSQHYLRLFCPDGAPAPRIEAMAAEGVVFTRAFSNAPVCSVARTTLMSSCYAPRIGAQYHRKLQMAQLPDDLRLFPFHLRQAGYYTSNNRKKDYNVVEGEGVWDESSRKASWRRRPTPDTPFFHMMSTGVSHEGRLHFKPKHLGQATQTDPGSVALAPYHPDTPLFRYTYARYHDCMGKVDEQVGRVLSQLEEDGVLEDTFVFYFGDHGGVLPGSKGYIHEAGLHVPLVVRIPANFSDLVPLQRGTRSEAFVSFIDFGPTVLRLAGVPVAEGVDGRPFLGTGVAASDLTARTRVFCYADRFDEKYDLCRSLRVGPLKYIRNYQAFLPDGLQNNYRYIQLAYQEWRRLYREGKLNALQSRFFEAKPVEELYDVVADPHQTRNLAGASAYAAKLQELRGALQAQVKSLPDLSFFPESVLIDEGLADPVAFGQTHRDRISRLVDVADLCLLPWSAAKPGLLSALDDEDPWARYWALIACSCLRERARELVPEARERLADSELLVRVRAAEFLAILGVEDPRPVIIDVLARTESPAEALITLNTVVYINDHIEGCRFDPADIAPNARDGQVKRRLQYLAAATPQ